jgi:hypothetical protein
MVDSGQWVSRTGLGGQDGMCYSCRMRWPVMQRLLVASVALAALWSCRAGGTEPTSHESAVKSVNAGLSSEIQRSEQRAAKRDAERVCERPILVYDGSIEVNSSDYLHSVARGEEFVDEPIDGLDRVISKSTRVRFTLDYPFETPFAGVVAGEITLRRTIDAIRAGFRKMYEGSEQRDIAGMHNKDVTGPYGRAFHVIDDLVIERIDLCADDSLAIFIGS